MNKTNKICIAIIIICVILVGGFCTFLIINHKSDVKSDALKFKEEYEAYNGKEVNDKKYFDVSIDEENPIVYKTGQEIVEILKSEKAVVYFGFASCPWCRNVIEPLIEVAKEKNIEKIYYVDIYDMRDSYEFQGSIIPKKTKEGSKSYYEILEILDEKLEKYYVTDSKGNRYDTGVKRLYAPTIVVADNGEVKDVHVGSIDSQKDPFAPLDDKGKEDLKNKLSDLLDKVYTIDVCTEGSAC